MNIMEILTAMIAGQVLMQSAHALNDTISPVNSTAAPSSSPIVWPSGASVTDSSTAAPSTNPMVWSNPTNATNTTTEETSNAAGGTSVSLAACFLIPPGLRRIKAGETVEVDQETADRLIAQHAAELVVTSESAGNDQQSQTGTVKIRSLELLYAASLLPTTLFALGTQGGSGTGYKKLSLEYIFSARDWKTATAQVTQRAAQVVPDPDIEAQQQPSSPRM